MDNIRITKIWEDINFFEINMAFTVKQLYCDVNLYAIKEDLKNFTKLVLPCVDKTLNKYVWTAGDASSDDFVSISVISTDKYGHVSLKVKCTSSTDDENCGFYTVFNLSTEIGLLETFSKKLDKFSMTSCGDTIQLIDDYN